MNSGVAVFLFHRDLRLLDNTALIAASKSGCKVLPLFVFPDAQINPSRNEYFSHPAVQFMCECLADLDQVLRQKLESRLWMIRAKDTVVALQNIHKVVPFQSVYSNRDETVYARERDKQIHDWCQKNDVEYVDAEDYGLVSLQDGLLPDGRPYSVLAQYYARFLKDVTVPKVAPWTPRRAFFVSAAGVPSHRIEGLIETEDLVTLYRPTSHARSKGGRSQGLLVLKELTKHKQYAAERDFPAIEGTTRASAHLKYGTISVREMYWAIHKLMGPDNALIRELVFRDFYYKIYALRPELQRGVAFREELDRKITWKTPGQAPKEWKAWTTGTTGYPLVDAGMRQLATEGWMHNRVRMLVASVATRYYELDWRACARYFYAQLVDADPFSNTAGWQWAAGIGVDSAPYWRKPFSPYRQSKRFDKDATYIKRWVPELRDVKPQHLHRWGEEKVRALYPNVSYPSPREFHP